MSAFKSTLVVQYVGEEDEEKWMLLQDFVYESDVAGMTIIVPKGTITDFSSVPRLPLAYWLTGGKAKKASVVHDYLCVTKDVSREMADAVFVEAAELQGVPAWRRKLMWMGVRGYAIVTGKDD